MFSSAAAHCSSSLGLLTAAAAMAGNQMYPSNNSSSYGGGGVVGLSDPYGLRYQSSSDVHQQQDKFSSPSSSIYNPSDALLKYGGAGGGGYPVGSRIAAAGPLTSWSSGGGGYDPLLGIKRLNQASYHQNVLENHNTFGQSEAMFSTNPLAKRPRVETATNLPIYPQRPGEKDCTHYMLTRTCKFGEACMFDHPIWVPEGGIPDWKEVPLAPSETLPERPGEADCPYFLKTQKCKFGFRCKFNHPKDKAVIPPSNAVETTSVLPERPSEPTCTFYMKTGKCRFGAVCKFHHPKDIEIPPPEQPGQHENDNGVLSEYGVNSVLGTTRIGGDPNLVKPLVNNYAPAMLHNSKGLPMRQGEADCPFYLKTGSCKYGATCRYNHPPGISSSGVSSNGTMMINPAVAAANNMNFGGPLNPLVPPINPRFAQTTTMQQQLGFGVGPLPPPSNISIYPQRPGQTECDYYMKTGVCKFGERCKFHHPFNRSAPAPNQPTAVQQQQPSVVLTLAGLPRREGAIICPFYMKTGTCKYGVQCRYDHPPPGEAIKMAAATLQGGATSSVAATSGEEDKVGGGDETSNLQQQ